MPGERTREVTLGLERLLAPRAGSKGQARRPALPSAVLKLGATSLSSGGVNWRVYADPAGEPFCLCWD